MINRMISAILLKPELYQKVESDRSATTQGVLIVLISGIATAFALLAIGSEKEWPERIMDAFLFGITIRLLGWLLLSGIISIIGAKMFPAPDTDADWSELSRTVAFAHPTAILTIFGAIGLIEGLVSIFYIVFIAALILQMAATAIAIKHALNYTTTIRTVVVTVVSYIPYVLIIWFAIRPLVTLGADLS